MLALLALSAALATPLADGVVIDPAHPSMAFVMRPQGGIAAVDTHSGRTEWAATLGDKPLEVDHGALLVTSDRDAHGTLHVRLLSTLTGSELADCGTLALPDWAPGLEEHVGKALSTRGDLRRGALVASWHASTWYSGGKPPPADVAAEARRDAGGAVACTRDRAHRTAEITAEAARQRARKSLVVERRTVDGQEAWVYEHHAKGGPTVTRVLQRAGVWGAASIDARHALVVAWAPKGGTLTTVYDMGTGASVGTLRNFPYGAGFVVVDGAVITVTREGLVAIDLGTGTPRWRVPVRDLQFRGPWPP